VLGQYKEISAKRVISLKDGAGFAFDKPGEYSLTAEFSMGSPENFAPFAGQAKSAMGTFHSTKLAFCIEACILEPLQVRNNAPRSALDAVRQFYTYITRTNSSGFLMDEQRKRSGRFSANGLLSRSTASERVTKIITGGTARFFAPTQSSPQHLGWRTVCSRVPMTQQLQAFFKFLAVEPSEKTASTF
jgi:hypothetical protein